MKVVIDTNILENMLNPSKNRNAYLTEMVSKIVARQTTVCLDAGERIDNQYHGRLGVCIARAKESVARQILQFFIAAGTVPYPHQERHEVDKTDDLMKCIGRQIPLEEDLDRVLVYVAARAGATLITDDYDHILSEDGEREEKLKQCAATYANTTLELMNSHRAKAMLDNL